MRTTRLPVPVLYLLWWLPLGVSAGGGGWVSGGGSIDIPTYLGIPNPPLGYLSLRVPTPLPIPISPDTYPQDPNLPGYLPPSRTRDIYPPPTSGQND